MKLYLGPLSLFSWKVAIALDEKGIVHEREFVAFTQAAGYQPRHPAVLAANPRRQVPVLLDGDLALYDSTVIFEYLEELYQPASLSGNAAGPCPVPPPGTRCRRDSVCTRAETPLPHRTAP